MQNLYAIFGSVSLPPTNGKTINRLLLKQSFTSNNLQIMSLTFPRLLVFAKAVFNSALRNVFSSNVSECKEVGGSDFTILLSEFELSKILVIVQIQIFTQ